MALYFVDNGIKIPTFASKKLQPLILQNSLKESKYSGNNTVKGTQHFDG